MSTFLLPRSLFGRLALLLFLVMGLRDLGAYFMFHAFTDTLRSQRLAGQLVTQVETLGELLDGMDQEDRTALITRMAQGRYLRLLPETSDTPGHPLPARHEKLAETLEEHLGYPTEVRTAREGMWLRVQYDQHRFWLLSPRQPRERPFPWHWFAGIALMGVLSLGGAFLVVWRVNGPLRRLVEATTLLGQGKKPTLATPEGPEELRTLSLAFNRMMADMEIMEGNRAMLLAGVSHDLRTPLARLRLSLDMGAIEAELRDGMVQDIEEMDALLDQFLDFAKNEQTEAPTLVDPNESVAAVCARYLRLGKKVNFQAQSVSSVTLRPLAWQRLVTNLLDNAARYGGGSDIDVQTEKVADTLYLRVMDRGPGIPIQERERVMRPFMRLDQARSGAGRAGLGLAIVERIAQVHGGRVVLLDRTGGGLEVRVEVPIDQSSG
ncbi:MAG: HAMP domain-containing protein [Magnetococcales bacterium]|nr:HAMP domain-containing protein [Magnetococcales bacterium]